MSERPDATTSPGLEGDLGRTDPSLGARASAAMLGGGPLADEGALDDPLAQVMMASLFPSQIRRPKIGRFDLLEFLGEGGMGSVYLAYDERLDRRVAIKFLRAIDESGQAQARLLREAQALARLSHPNIVAVHEAWEEEGRVHVAMEYVEGENLAEWQAEGRPQGELLDAYRQAGEGLAAAHDAGLVHRDFKPHNAVRRADGVVKVLDFGLARAMSEETGHASGGGEVGAAALARDLTMTGAIMGTPVYMAPEQHEGALADPRSDLFSFCVALWEALYRELPFPAGSMEELREAVLSGRRREPADARAVPTWIRRVLERGLQRRPEDRYPSMRALLRELGRDPARRRRRALAIVGGIAVAVASGFGIAELRAREEPAICAGDQVAAALWSGGRRAAARGGVLGAAIPAAEAQWQNLAPRLDAYAAALALRRVDACERHRGGLRSDTLYDLEVACLDRREAGFVRLAELLAAGDAAVILEGPKAIAGLPAIAACGDVEALAAEYPLPEEPATRARALALRQELARAQAEEAAGKYAEAEARAGEVFREAEGIDDLGLRAEAALRWGSAGVQRRSAEAGERLEMSLWTAIRTEQRRVAAEAAALRIYMRAEIEERFDDIAEVIELAIALVDRRGAADWRIRWLLANNSAIAHEQQGALVPALAAYRDALALVPGREGVFERAATLQNMAPVQVRLGERAAGERAARAAFDEIRALYGAAHPSTASAEVVLAGVLRMLGRQAEAAARVDAALAGVGDAAPPWMLLEAARGALARGDLAAARGYCARGKAKVGSGSWLLPFEAVRALAAAREGDAEAAAILDGVDPASRAENPDFVTRERALVAWTLGRPAEVEALLGTLEREGMAPMSRANVELLRARALVARGALEEARAILEALLGEAPEGEARPLDAMPRLFEPEARSIALQTLALAEAAAGRSDRARARAEAALAELAGFDDPSPQLAEARATLARVVGG